MVVLNDWEKEEVIHKDKIINFEILMERNYIGEITDGFFWLKEDYKAVLLDVLRMTNEKLADDLGIQKVEEETKKFINTLNVYNEVKDIGQELVGKIANLRQTTTKFVYRELEIDFEE